MAKLEFADLADEGEVLHRVELDTLGIESRQRGVTTGDEQQCVAVGYGARHVFAGDQSTGAGARLHDEAAVDRGADAIADQAAQRIGLPTVQSGQNDSDRTGRQIGRLRAHERRRHRHKCRGEAVLKDFSPVVNLRAGPRSHWSILPSCLIARPTSASVARTRSRRLSSSVAEFSLNHSTVFSHGKARLPG